MFDQIFDPPAPDPYERFQDIEAWLTRLNANLKVLAMPFKDTISWGIYLDDKKGRYHHTGEGKTFSEAVNNIWSKFLDVQKQYYNP